MKEKKYANALEQHHSMLITLFHLKFYNAETNLRHVRDNNFLYKIARLRDKTVE